MEGVCPRSTMTTTIATRPGSHPWTPRPAAPHPSREPDPSAKFRQLPRRVTPDEMVTTQPVSLPDTRDLAGTEDERALRWAAG